MMQIDECDIELLNYTWYKNIHGYFFRPFWRHNHQHNLSMARSVMERKLGRKIKKGEQVDHIDGDRENNTRDNLRLVTQHQNHFNLKLSKLNTSGHKGIRFREKHSVYEASITHNRKQIFLGHFKELESAKAARNAAEIKYFGEYRRK